MKASYCVTMCMFIIGILLVISFNQLSMLLLQLEFTLTTPHLSLCLSLSLSLRHWNWHHPSLLYLLILPPLPNQSLLCRIPSLSIFLSCALPLSSTYLFSTYLVHFCCLFQFFQTIVLAYHDFKFVLTWRKKNLGSVFYLLVLLPITTVPSDFYR